MLDNYMEMVLLINDEYNSLSNLSNDELRRKLYFIKDQINIHLDSSNILDNYLVQVYAIVKETARRFAQGDIIVSANDYDCQLAKNYDFIEIQGDNAVYKNQWDVYGVPFKWDMVHYDEQLLGGILLHHGFAAEMATGEGKTLVATLPVFLNALTHKGVHLMTSNDYLSRRDFETTRPIYMFYGLSVGCIENYERSDERRKMVYKMDISFGTYSSFTFDYLFDHLADSPEECVQLSYNYAIIDELDSVLIDDANTPHIVGGGNSFSYEKEYKEKFPIIQELLSYGKGILFNYDSNNKSAYFTQEGKKWLASRMNIVDLYDYERIYNILDFEDFDNVKKSRIRENLFNQNVLLQLLTALTVYERDVDYIVEESGVKILDQYTGRVRRSCRYEHGLHTALEVKENVKVDNDFEGTAVISLKNYFRLYKKIAGMSGTLVSVQEELNEVYSIRTAVVPTHRPIIREDLPLKIFKTEKDKNRAIVDYIIENNKIGRPILVGTTSLKHSELICEILNEQGIDYKRLDAKTLGKEAIIIKEAGQSNNITVATSVAGRGTDIKPSDEAISKGGLLVLGTAMYESLRVERQLRGRSGRQGNPGSSIFFVSLEDSILKNLKRCDYNLLMAQAENLDGFDISCDEIRYYFVKAQSVREEYLKKQRAETARKDDVIEPHRRKFYQQRNAVLFNLDYAEKVVDELIESTPTLISKIKEQIDFHYNKVNVLVKNYMGNNFDKSSLLIPFSDNRCTFAISFNVANGNFDYEYFSKELKRQIVLQVYDKEWKKFVMYVLSNLDSNEIAVLNTKYDIMMNEIGSTIISRLQNSTIPVDSTNRLSGEPTSIHRGPSVAEQNINLIKPDDLCPCGSRKKFCECHGNNTRRIRRHR